MLAAGLGGSGPLAKELKEGTGGPPGFPNPHSLPYPGGMGYVFGYNATAALAAVAERVGLLDAAPEDLVVGFWLAALGHDRVQRVHSPCFHNTALPLSVPSWLTGLREHHFWAAPCTASSLLVHYMTPELWEAIDDRGLLACGTSLC